MVALGKLRSTSLHAIALVFMLWPVCLRHRKGTGSTLVGHGSQPPGPGTGIGLEEVSVAPRKILLRQRFVQPRMKAGREAGAVWVGGKQPCGWPDEGGGQQAYFRTANSWPGAQGGDLVR